MRLDTKKWNEPSERACLEVQKNEKMDITPFYFRATLKPKEKCHADSEQPLLEIYLSILRVTTQKYTKYVTDISFYDQ